MAVKEKYIPDYLLKNYADLKINLNQLNKITDEYPLGSIERALEYKEWAIIELVFNFNIPSELKFIIEKEYKLGNLDESKIYDVVTVEKIKTIYETFKRKHNRLPKLFPIIICATDEWEEQMLAASFNIKAIRYVLTLKEVNSDLNRLIYAIAFGNKVYDVVNKLKKNNKDLNNFISGLPPKFPIKNKSLYNWIIKHAGTTQNQLIHDVMEFWEEDGFPREQQLAVMKEYINHNRASKEWEFCMKKYPSVFKSSFSCNIEDNPITIKNESARILGPNDKLQSILGHLTVCCQKLNGSGEPCLMEGLINPNSGFLVFERETKILAQSWIWLSKPSNILVLDNIELADNRKPEDIIHLLKEWVKRCPYNNVQMGIGYNRVNLGLPVESEDLEWYKQYWEYKYTDANKRVWLKKEDIMCI